MEAETTPDSRLFGAPPFMVMLCGSKNSGKSQICRYAIRQYALSFNDIVVIAPTALNGFYQTIMDASHIHDTYSDELIQSIMDKQAACKKAGKTRHTLIVLDDILAAPNVNFERRKASVLNTIFCANRHFLISMVVIVQKMKGVPPLCRLNVDWVCFTRCMRSAWADIYEEYSGNVEKKEFYRMLEESTSEYKVLLYRSKVARPSEHYSCFRIPAEFMARKFRLVF